MKRRGTKTKADFQDSVEFNRELAEILKEENAELKKRVRYGQVELCRSRAQIKLLKAKLTVAELETAAARAPEKETK